MLAKQPYTVPRAAAPCDLYLDGNEGQGPTTAELANGLLTMTAGVNRYPNAAALTAQLAQRWGVDVNQLLITAGGDDGLDRICRVCFQNGGELLFPSPGFEMVRRYTELAGGTVIDVPWRASFPLDALVAARSENTKAVVVTSPNNPTGASINAATLRQLRQRMPGVLLIVDLAYIEFCDEDLTETALQLEDTVVIRTFSKAWGLAGLRVGVALSNPSFITALNAAGAPYSTSSVSIALISWALNNRTAAVSAFIEQVRTERVALEALLQNLGYRPTPSQGNFVFAEVDDALWLRDSLAGLGIAIRAFPNRPNLKNAVRITCPGNEADFTRLCNALRTVCSPQAYLFDIDGVLCDVRESYRSAIQQTTQAFGVTVTDTDIQNIKSGGNANNDWVVTQQLCAAANCDVPLEQIRDVFQALLEDAPNRPGLWRKEKTLTGLQELTTLANGRPVAAVTGRPRKDAVRFLENAGLSSCFDTLVCMEDAPAKPNPQPVELALERLGVTRAWMFGDTPDDMRAARAANVLPIGVSAPGEDTQPLQGTLTRAGAARVFARIQDVAEVIR